MFCAALLQTNCQFEHMMNTKACKDSHLAIDELL